MNYKEIELLYKFNNEIRDRLLLESSFQKTPFDKIKFIVDYFLSNLDKNIILKIDNAIQFEPFSYDYSFLEDFSDPYGRQLTIKFLNGIYAHTLHQADIDQRDNTTKIYPSIFALKRGTCQMFANEIKRFALDFGLDCKIEKTFSYCYDCFDGKNRNNKPIHTNRIIKMQHYYNLIKIDDKFLKIDVAAILTALDFMEKNPDAPLIDISNLYFSDKHNYNPFENMNDYFKKKSYQ